MIIKHLIYGDLCVSERNVDFWLFNIMCDTKMNVETIIYWNSKRRHKNQTVQLSRVNLDISLCNKLV